MTQWRYIADDGCDAPSGLATDEVLMDYHQLQEAHQANGALRLYSYRNHCALVGRFQNIHAELNLPFCQENDFSISRRLTGGGAIIMGKDQLGVCLTLPDSGGLSTWQLYRKLSKPIIESLSALGIEAGFRGKNDLEVNGRKIAGLGIYSNPHGTIQFHTSLLLDLDVEMMLKVLNIPLQKVADKAQHSVNRRITTVSREYGSPIGLEEFRLHLKSTFEKSLGVSLFHDPLSQNETKAVQHLARDKYSHPEWLYRQTPQPDMNGMGLKKTHNGLLRAYVALKGQTIKSLLITGDYLEHEDLFSELEDRLKWSPAEMQNIASIVQDVFDSEGSNLEGITTEDMTTLIWRASLSAMKEVHYNYRGSCYQPKDLEPNRPFESTQINS